MSRRTRGSTTQVRVKERGLGGVRLELSLAEDSNLPIALLDGSSHVVRYANPALLDLDAIANDGSEAHALVGKRLANSFESPELLERMLERVFETGCPEYLCAATLVTGRGRAFSATVSACLLHGDGTDAGALLVQVLLAETASHRAASDDSGHDVELRSRGSVVPIARRVVQRPRNRDSQAGRASMPPSHERQRGLRRALCRDVRHPRVPGRDRSARARAPAAAIPRAHHSRFTRPLVVCAPRGRSHHRSAAAGGGHTRSASVDFEEFASRRPHAARLAGRAQPQGGPVARPAPGLHLGKCDIVSIAREVVDELSAVHGNRFVLECGIRVCAGVWSADELRRSLWNLLINALEYGSDGAPITVCIERTSVGVALSVRNSGRRFPSRIRLRLFTPFTQSRAGAPNGMPSWGLGLALVRGCAEAHGGHVRVESRANVTTFTIEIPLDARPHQDLS